MKDYVSFNGTAPSNPDTNHCYTRGGGGGGVHSLTSWLPTRVHQPLKRTLNGVMYHVTFAPLNGVRPAHKKKILNGVGLFKIVMGLRKIP